MHVYTYICFVCMHIHAYSCLYVCVPMYTHTKTHTLAHTRKDTHTITGGLTWRLFCVNVRFYVTWLIHSCTHIQRRRYNSCAASLGAPLCVHSFMCEIPRSFIRSITHLYVRTHKHKAKQLVGGLTWRATVCMVIHVWHDTIIRM